MTRMRAAGNFDPGRIRERPEYPYVTPEQAFGVASFGEPASMPLATLETTWRHYHHGDSYTRRGWVVYTEVYGPRANDMELMVLVDPDGRYALILRRLWERNVAMLRIADWVVDHGWPSDWRLHENHHTARVREAWRKASVSEICRESVHEWITRNGAHS